MLKKTRLVLLTGIVFLTASWAFAEDKSAEPFTGSWQTNIVDLHLTQSGKTVTGTYDYKGGSLTGSVTGNRLDYSWTQTDGKTGTGYFIVSDNGSSIDGCYGYGEDNKNGGHWTGTRKK
jgi:hypothetical protein